MSSVTLYLLGIKSNKLGGCFMGNSPIVNRINSLLDRWRHNPLRAALRGLWRHLRRWLVSVYGLKLEASRLHRIAVKRVIKSVVHKTAPFWKYYIKKADALCWSTVRPCLWYDVFMSAFGRRSLLSAKCVECVWKPLCGSIQAPPQCRFAPIGQWGSVLRSWCRIAQDLPVRYNVPFRISKGVQAIPAKIHGCTYLSFLRGPSHRGPVRCLPVVRAC